MATKPEDRSKLDQVQQVRKGYMPEENAAATVQVNNLVPARFSRLAMKYNACCCITKITYFCDNFQEQTSVVTGGDNCSSLNSTYFNLYSARDVTKYYIWYDVDGGGTDPAVSCSTGIKISLSKNDPAQVVALATKQKLDEEIDFDASLDVGQKNVIITNEVGGISTNSTDNNTGFTLSSPTEGMNRIVAILIFDYDANGNVIRIYRSSDVMDNPENNLIALDSGCMLLTCSGCNLEI